MKVFVQLICFLILVSIQSMAIVKIDPSKTLFINDLSVVNSPEVSNQELSFGNLFSKLFSNSKEAQEGLEFWFQEFEIHHFNIYGHIAPALPKFQENFSRAWPRDSKGLPQLDQAPFILNAIVNRVDLSSSILNREAGEIRFIYQAVNQPEKKTRPFMLILEFKLPYFPASGIDARYWAQRWAQLNDLEFGALYNKKLKVLMADIFEFRGTSIRDLFIAMRMGAGEFNYRPADGHVPETRTFKFNSEGRLSLSANEQTPDESYKIPNEKGGRANELVEWIKENVHSILNETAILPAEFLSLRNEHPVQKEVPWASELVNSSDPELSEARQKFARMTCNGCHSLYETSTIVISGDRISYNWEAKPSGFLINQLKLRAENLESLLKGEGQIKNISRDH